MKKLLGIRNWRRHVAGVLALFLLLSVCPIQAGAAEPGEAIVALGADLTPEQRATVLELMQLTEADLENYTVITITNDQEHQYLDGYVPANVIGSRSLSSVLVSPLAKGSGLQVTTHNISYCTVSMYRNALLTAGIEDAEVIVAAPANISGTAALIGAVKAYETMTGEAVADDVLETATNELVLTGELGDVLGNSEKASEVIAYIKQQILESGAETPEEIEEIVRNAADKYSISLSEEDMAKIRELMGKISQLDLDVGALAEQAQELYQKIQDMGLEVDGEKVGNFFTRLLDSILEFFKELFS
ncbi:MAG: DUF1002 domain-containing protein [Lachnospiraceae bacterium]|jgi:uncharacterized protein YpuA (DUF1002 family)|nr:DUF1002 domain-containing protein [Lachnospiraceae bacterium]